MAQAPSGHLTRHLECGARRQKGIICGDADLLLTLPNIRCGLLKLQRWSQVAAALMYPFQI